MKSLPARATYSAERRRRLLRLIESTREAPPPDLALVVRETLGVDLATKYAGAVIAHPFGKASGQLSCTPTQVDDDLASGIAFVVLKTVIAEDETGTRTMGAWATNETRMRVEQRTAADGRQGWTVTWHGRGWSGTLSEYADFFGKALRCADRVNVPVVPSVKYHLPRGGEPMRRREYSHTTTVLLDVWRNAGRSDPMPMEKDFSPTLAGDDLSRERADVLSWLRTVPGAITDAAGGRVRLGVKVMNAMFDDDFQVEMLGTLATEADPSPAFLVVFNRLFDPDRGVAYGGWDLSDRNLRVLDRARERGLRLPPLSATGNICSGRVMVEYARRGCENGQVHTFFQVPNSLYTATGGRRTARALHTLLLEPDHGLIAWLWHLHEAGQLDERDGALHFKDVVERGRY